MFIAAKFKYVLGLMYQVATISPMTVRASARRSARRELLRAIDRLRRRAVNGLRDCARLTINRLG